MDNITIRVLELPLSVRGVTAMVDDGSYCIFINSRYSVRIQNEILWQELHNIPDFDFENYENLKFEEQQAAIV